MTGIGNYEDVIDVRDVIKRYEELEDTEERDEDDEEEMKMLGSLLDDLKGCGGDEQWKGDWYPVTLIRDSYFEEYAQELANDIGAINREITWPHTCIDWGQAAEQLQMDYSTVEYNGVDYWYR